MLKKYSFPLEKRIRKGEEYKQLFTKGKRYYSKHCRIYIAFESEQRKMGVVISRKIKGSVIRNRHKRLIREFFRLNQLRLKPGLKLVIFVATCFHPACYEAIDNELQELLKKANVLA